MWVLWMLLSFEAQPAPKNCRKIKSGAHLISKPWMECSWECSLLNRGRQKKKTKKPTNTWKNHRLKHFCTFYSQWGGSVTCTASQNADFILDKGTWISSVMCDILCLITWPTEPVKKQEQGKAKVKHIIYPGEKQDSHTGDVRLWGRSCSCGIEMRIWVWSQPATCAAWAHNLSVPLGQGVSLLIRHLQALPLHCRPLPSKSMLTPLENWGL